MTSKKENQQPLNINIKWGMWDKISLRIVGSHNDVSLKRNEFKVIMEREREREKERERVIIWLILIEFYIGFKFDNIQIL